MMAKNGEDPLYKCNLCPDGQRFKLLPCQHYYCEDCFEKYLEHFPKDQIKDGTYTCPECRERFKLPVPDYRQANNYMEDREREAVSQPEETNVMLEIYSKKVADDVRCDLTCHPACAVCGTLCMKYANESFCHSGGSERDSDAGGTMKCIFCFPIWAFCMMKTLEPCIRVFSDHEHLQSETSQTASQLRGRAMDLVINQHATLFMKPWFILVWPFVMIASLIVDIGSNIADIVNDDPWIPAVIACGFNSLLLFLWIGFAVFNFKTRLTREQIDDHTSHNRQKLMKRLQQQQIVSEVTLYPQLCVSAFLLQDWDTITALPFFLGLGLMIVIWVLRIYFVVKYREFIPVVFARVLFTFIGNYIVMMVLFTCLIMRHIEIEDSILFMIPIVISLLTTNIINTAMFYISHMYEFTLQAALIIIRFQDPQFMQQAQNILKDFTSLPAFHKNLYAMAFAWTGSAAYFWSIPTITVLIMGIIDLPTAAGIMAIVAFMLNAIFNYRTLLVNCAAHFTAAFVMFYVMFIMGVSFGAAFLIYGTLVALILLALLMWCVCTIWCGRGDTQVAEVGGNDVNIVQNNVTNVNYGVQHNEGANFGTQGGISTNRSVRQNQSVF